MDSDNLRQPRRKLMRRRSSIELRISNEITPSISKKSLFLSLARTSTFAIVTSIMCTYAWLFSAGVGTTCLVASLYESAQSSLVSLQKDSSLFQDAINELEREIVLSKRDVGRFGTTRLLPIYSEDVSCASGMPISLASDDLL